jgi:guanylate kinase
MSRKPDAFTELADPAWRGRLFVLSGPSGSGKSLLVQRLTRREPGVVRAVTATTRPPAPGERDGVDYRFVDRETFLDWIEEGALLEHVEYCGHYYGTPAASVLEPLRAGKSVILVIDVEGAAVLRERVPGVVTIFVNAPSEAELERRIRGRGREPEGAIQRRLERARAEMREAPRYDHVIVNDDLDEAVQRLAELVGAA